MPKLNPRHRYVVGGNRSNVRSGNPLVGSYRTNRKPKKEKPPDKNIGREGYAPCEVCGYWVRTRIDETLRAHATDGGNTTRFNVPCIGAQPRTGLEWAEREREKNGKIPLEKILDITIYKDNGRE